MFRDGAGTEEGVAYLLRGRKKLLIELLKARKSREMLKIEEEPVGREAAGAVEAIEMSPENLEGEGERREPRVTRFLPYSAPIPFLLPCEFEKFGSISWLTKEASSAHSDSSPGPVLL